MKALVQRVNWAEVKVEGKVVGRIERGLLALIGFARGDENAAVDVMVEKILNLRIFASADGRFDKSVRDVKGSVLAVSQFTLLADCRKGRRPNFQKAAPPELAAALYEDFLVKLGASGIPMASGVFQAHMEVASANDGPVTIMIELPSQAPTIQEET